MSLIELNTCLKKGDYMLCDLCNGEKCVVVGAMSFKSRPLGTIIVPNVKYSLCQVCGEKTIDYHESEKVHSYVVKKEAEALMSLPIGDFISLNEAAKILCVTKQAFSKNSRISRGFVYSVVVDGRTLYYKKSVEEFKRNGKDGRINLLTKPMPEKRSNVISFIPNISPQRGEMPKYFIPQPKAGHGASRFEKVFIEKRSVRC